MKRPVASRTSRFARVLMGGAAMCGVLAAVASHAGEEDETRAVPTIAVLESLAEEAGREVSPGLSADTSAIIVLEVEPEENTWFVEAGLMKGFAPRTTVREPGEDAVLAVTVGITRMGVMYENVRRDGLFGSRIVSRTVFLEADVSAFERSSGQLLLRTGVTRERRDDVPVDDLPRLEEPGLSWTTGRVPPEGFFSSVLEPVITVGAIAVAVILLFTVRS